MKTLLYKKSNGKKIVVGFDNVMIDTIETNNKVDTEVKKSDEYKDYVDYRDKTLPSVENKEQGLGILKTKMDAVKAKTEELYPGCITYFTPRVSDKDGEIIISDDEFNTASVALTAARDNDKALEMVDEGDYQEVVNHQGKEYYVDNNGTLEKHEIEHVGEDYPAGAITEPTDDQLSKFNNQEDGGQTKANALSFALREAAMKKNELEIQGASAADALTQSKDWYDAEVIRINNLYG